MSVAALAKCILSVAALARRVTVELFIMAALTVPAGYQQLNVYLHVPNSRDALNFYVKALGAVPGIKLTMPDGSIGHAEMKIGDATVMMADENPAWGNPSPKTLGGSGFGLMLYVPDVDTAFAQAIAAGATVMMPVKDHFYGDRAGTLIDPFGHKWTLATHQEDVPEEEMQSRMDAMMSSNGNAG